MRRGRLANTELAEKALLTEASRLFEQGEVNSFEDGLRVAASTIRGAADRPGGTVESVQTCTNLQKEAVRGLTTADTVTARRDELADSEDTRAQLAEKGSDEAEKWLKENDPNYQSRRRDWRA